ncbi:MAG: hypothetical protein A2Y03_01750 [Omnitrophica WOR_2 bacterium GWF2_38_59]|nr:MAG: hypothetical protein A2Y06_04095 [Omnitrophica WOR_2 bacterium GWA2_37_7]OGX25766.1 MAG: hypothetical protein A2Y03_01750 [Omnitrophica WOR_2 bacterium GWF2_38_59]OGX48350.1 MAG: hypothetical protein A2243_07875 [Omnitrophica WOR_2 bacterium RIFOXYA2_FULL_38_17]OGX54749.1 MAG: hypothetical protein A2267_06015 [Omnitrophica WOR_2 bacterium RIFOXYA12_FULL_38_10]OGX55091.1 MAG: hypothetical protein A2447_02850 [Omnitrophica WOR_2 bacterium RIFOXYC2_FULL_38_12]OGX58079.1 MAG: hypothetical 
MKTKTYLLTVAILLSAVSIFHLQRITFKWNAAIGSWTIPLWTSMIGFIVTAILAYLGFKLIQKDQS